MPDRNQEVLALQYTPYWRTNGMLKGEKRRHDGYWQMHSLDSMPPYKASEMLLMLTIQGHWIFVSEALNFQCLAYLHLL